MKQKLFSFLAILLFVSGAHASGEESLGSWCQRHVGGCDLLKTMAQRGTDWRQEEGRQLNALKTAIGDGDIDVALLKKALEEQKTQAEAFLDQLKSVPAQERGFPLRTTKTVLNLTLVLENLEKDGWFASLLRTDFTGDIPDLVFADGGTRFDSSLGRAIKTTLTVAWMIAKEKGIQDLGEVFGSDWIKNSAFYIAIPLPEGFVSSYPWTIALSGKNYLIEAHNGYTFGGGHGDECLGEIPGKWPSYDCSSIVARSIGMTGVAPSTLHWFLYGMEGGYIPSFVVEKGAQAHWTKMVDDWKANESDTQYRDPLAERIEFCGAFAHESIVKLGMIWVRRQFNVSKITES